MDKSLEYQNQPVATASLRGHPYPVTCIDVSEDNLSVISGDEGGWVVLWDLTSKRPIGVFRAHEKALIKVQLISSENEFKFITHGRDNKLYIWKIITDLNLSIPLRNSDASEWQKPWLCHSQDVNALNFCGFSYCQKTKQLAVPSTMNSSKVDVYDISGDQLKRPIQALGSNDLEDNKLGILMTIELASDSVIVSWESGHIMVHDFKTNSQITEKCHSEPIMSLCRSGCRVASSAADSMIYFLKLNCNTAESKQSLIQEITKFDTKHKGHSNLDIRSDGKIWAISSWDQKVRIYSMEKNKKKLAVIDLENTKVVKFGPLIGNNNNNSSLMTIDRRKSRIQSRHHLFASSNDRIVIYELY